MKIELGRYYRVAGTYQKRSEKNDVTGVGQTTYEAVAFEYPPELMAVGVRAAHTGETRLDPRTGRWRFHSTSRQRVIQFLTARGVNPVYVLESQILEALDRTGTFKTITGKIIKDRVDAPDGVYTSYYTQPFSKPVQALDIGTRILHMGFTTREYVTDQHGNEAYASSFRRDGSIRVSLFVQNLLAGPIWVLDSQIQQEES